MEREEFRDLGVRDETELARIKAEVSDSNLYNEDLAPTGPEERTWTTYNIAALWIGMSIVITTYLLAAGLMAAGMNWWQALLTISLGNIIVLIPMLLNAHASTKYGVPFPVFAVLIGVIPVLPSFFKAATTPNFAGVFQSPSFIEGLYNYGLFFTFFVAGLAYLLLNMIPGLAPQPRREPEAT